jgi:hypothetical protein
MLVTVIILSVVLLTTFYIIWNLLRKVEKLEDMLDNLASYVNSVSELIQMSQEKVNEIDANGTFASDDEVGFFFENLKEIQDILTTANINEPNNRNNKEEERS